MFNIWISCSIIPFAHDAFNILLTRSYGGPNQYQEYVLYKIKFSYPLNELKAVGTLWQDLFKPPQRTKETRLWPRPLWLFVGIPTALAPELASRWAEHRLLWWMSLYIFLMSVFITLNVCVIIIMVSLLLLAVVPWSLLGRLFTFFKCVLLIICSFYG